VADVGCGNGKNIPAVQDNGGLAIGIDISSNLANICANMGFEVTPSDPPRDPLCSLPQAAVS
jgi:alkylated DNA repair protein alkB family protein 8